MGLESAKIKTYIRALTNKRGAEMVEGAISLPLIILCAMLLVRTFVFYLEILNTSVSEHIDALERSDSYEGAGFQVYKNTEEVRLIRGGVLRFDVSKEIESKCYMLNEDLLARAGGIVP